MSARVWHAERVPPRLQHFVAWWTANGPFDIVCTSGTRTDDEQLFEWAKGRAQLTDGAWHIVTPEDVVTYAMTAASSAHGRAAGADFHPVREVFHNPAGQPVGVKSIYLGSKRKEDQAIYDEALRRLLVMAQLAEDECGLESGRNFPDPDLPHLQLVNWRDLPVVG